MPENSIKYTIQLLLSFGGALLIIGGIFERVSEKLYIWNSYDLRPLNFV